MRVIDLFKESFDATPRLAGTGDLWSDRFPLAVLVRPVVKNDLQAIRILISGRGLCEDRFIHETVFIVTRVVFRVDKRAKRIKRLAVVAAFYLKFLQILFSGCLPGQHDFVLHGIGIEVPYDVACVDCSCD